MKKICRTTSDCARTALLYACLPLTLIASPAVLAGSGEDIFKRAPLYTVQIRTTVDMAFSEDARSASMGAGFVVDAERGWVMTNAHVAARSPSQVRVRFQRGEYHEATKVYVDPYLDLAILELDESQREGREVAKLDCQDLPPIGHPVGAFGHPWDLVYTGTRGIISGVTSRIGTELIQTDAPINGGNSGGPLISLDSGKIVGLSTSSMNQDDDQNTNFAVPMIYACKVLRLLQEGKDPSPPQLLALFYEDLDDLGRLTVAKTYLPDDTLSLEVGDTINAVTGAPGEIANEGQLVHALRGRLHDFTLEITRAGKPMSLSGRLEPVARVVDRNGVYATGILIAPVNMRDSVELNIGQPLMVHDVKSGTLGDSLEIDLWDILVSIDGHPADTLDALYERLAAAERDGNSVVLVFKRWSSGRDRLYDYVERALTVEDLEFVGPRPLKHVAAKD